MIGRRLNPADPDYEIRRLLQKQAETKAELDRVRADAVTPGIPSNPGSIEIDPDNPHLYIYRSPTLLVEGHLMRLPISSLVARDPNSPGRVYFPTLSIQED